MFRGVADSPTGPFSPNTGALKRSDANLDSETDSPASPVAKRRSLHATTGFASLGQDAHVFDRTTSSPLNPEILDDSDQEYRLAGSPGSGSPFVRRDTQPSPTPGASTGRRNTSLRRSTLQQRLGEKTSWGRRAGAQQLAQMSDDISTPIFRSRPRISMDAFVPPLARDSPFSGTGPLPHPSMHPLPQQMPHPLSRSIRPSGPGNGPLEDTPMVFSDPPEIPNPNQIVDPFRFSIGPLGPLPALAGTSANVETRSDTPKEPHPKTGMFMSAGLVSKVDHDPEEDKGPVVPDTPCKKSSTTTFATYPPGLPASVAKLGRSPAAYSPAPRDYNDDSFGVFGNAGRGLNLFHNMGRGPQRRGSVLNLKGQSESPIPKDNDGRSTPEGWPPTPTKLFLTPTGGSGSNDVLESPSANRHTPPISAMKPFGSRAPSCT
ncbi:hypothetical protein IMZ48_30440 [Candidatus Bathyarchaeota archaeon]|nr:hypothetical protein [Candidatus Bathyarchaeota archaeon]